jgi:hypothetical protein
LSRQIGIYKGESDMSVSEVNIKVLLHPEANTISGEGRSVGSVAEAPTPLTLENLGDAEGDGVPTPITVLSGDATLEEDLLDSDEDVPVPFEVADGIIELAEDDTPTPMMFEGKDTMPGGDVGGETEEGVPTPMEFEDDLVSEEEPELDPEVLEKKT